MHVFICACADFKFVSDQKEKKKLMLEAVFPMDLSLSLRIT